MAETLKLTDKDGLGAQVRNAVKAKYRPALIVMAGKRVGERLSVQGNLLIGREPDTTLMLPDPGVSSRHAMLEDQGGSWVLVDLKSTNGTYVNGERIVEVELKHGDKIVFGTTLVRFEVQDDADQAYSEMIAELVHIDDLTGLYIRRRFETELSTLVQASLRGDTPVGLLVMDLDGIKQINDTHGHLFGAHTIAESGKLIGKLLEGKGFACRFGGDEFLAALPEHDAAEAALFAEQIRAAIGQHAFVHEGVTLHPGISIGVASFPADARDPKELFHRADEALYQAKRGGKNRVCRHGQGP
jgi:two-component system cell cycle response regulator